MVNIDNGISYNTATEATGGNVAINYNQMVGKVPSWLSGYCNRAIYAQNSNPVAGLPVSAVFNIRNNIIYKTYNGIKVFNFKKWSAKTDTNTIALKMKTSTTTQSGINHTNCVNSSAKVNYVVGEGITTNSESGMLGDGNTSVTFMCNKVESTYKGFEFTGATNVSFWNSNSMNNHLHSLYLTGIFGPQGTPYSPSDNTWLPSCAALPGGIFQTFNNNSFAPGGSKLYVRPNTTTGPRITDPWANGGISGLAYGGGYGPPLCPAAGWYDTCLIQVVSPPAYNACAPVYSHYPTGSRYARLAGGDYGDTVTTGNGNGGEERTTAGSVNITAGKKWITQMSVWEAMQADTTMADSFATLRAFHTLAGNSRYSWLTAIAGHLVDNDYTAPAALLGYNIDSLINTSTDDATGFTMADGTGADYVVQNYVDVYRYSIKYATAVLSNDDIADVAAIAALCPDIDGKIVFAARSLYYNITGSVLEPGDNCSGGEDYSRHGQQPIQPTIKNINQLTKTNQAYTLQPNPNNGNLTLQQKLNDNTSAKVQVWNAVGRVVLSTNIQFANGVVNVHIPDSMPGLYLLQLTDRSGNSFTRKFVIE